MRCKAKPRSKSFLYYRTPKGCRRLRDRGFRFTQPLPNPSEVISSLKRETFCPFFKYSATSTLLSVSPVRVRLRRDGMRLLRFFALANFNLEFGAIKAFLIFSSGRTGGLNLTFSATSGMQGSITYPPSLGFSRVFSIVLSGNG